MPDGDTTNTPPTTTQRLGQLRQILASDLVERDVPIRLALLAALAGEHVLLVGPPGTAKSTVARRLRLAFAEGALFERLLTRFTVPEELFGPLSIRGLEADRYERLTTGYLPSASVAFLDEIFKANSAILNALLTLLQEREFDNGTRREKTPLVAVIAASNELPEDREHGELAALYDRFLLRVFVPPVSKEGFLSLLSLRGDSAPSVNASLALRPEDLASIRETANGVEVPAEVLALLAELREFCLAERIPVSDRRFRKILRLLQVSALTNGRDRVSVWDCWLLQHCVWSAPEEREKVYAWYAARVGASGSSSPSRLTKLIVSFEGRLERERKALVQLQDKKGRLLFRAPDGKRHATPTAAVPKLRGTEPLYLAPPDAHVHQGYGGSGRIVDRANGGNGYTRQELAGLMLIERGRLAAFGESTTFSKYVADPANALTETMKLEPLLVPKAHPRAHVESCLREVDELGRGVEQHMSGLDQQIRSLHTEIANHLWVTADFAGPAARTLDESRATVVRLRDRIGALRRGFEVLPVETDAVEGVSESETGES